MKHEYPVGLHQTRRTFLGRAAGGIGTAALATLLGRDLPAADDPLRSSRGVVDPLHFAPKAKRVIYLCQAGGSSHLETFDHKPKLAQMLQS